MKQSDKESLEFQLYDWLEGHDIPVDEDGDFDEDDDLPGEFIIHSFGRCDDGKSVYAKIVGFTPYFYFLIPNKLQNKPKSQLEEMMKKIEFYFKSKDNKKVFYKFKSTLKEIQLVKLKRAEGFTNDKEFWFARLVFNNADGMKKYKSYLENNEISIPSVPELSKPLKYKLYEANLPPMLRCFHIREISGCSWVETTKYDLIEDDDEKESRCDIEIHVDWRNLNPIKKDHNAPFRICSFDIECYSIDGEFPQAKRKGDCVIQIGATYTKIGQSVPYRQYIGCLNETSAVENTIVESCETERELVLKFLDEINNNDCDIITGYNTFFFDEKYLYDRCKDILGIEMEMAYMSKLKNFKCNFKEMKLASSALGENLLRFWDTPGRIHIDLMKDIQKDFKLPSYKLDYVASYFIRGEVVKFKLIEEDKFKQILPAGVLELKSEVLIELECKAVKDINPGDYVHLEVIKGFVSDEVGEKYQVLEINSNDKKIIVKGDDFLLSELETAKLGGTIYWSQAKDDVGPKDIFKFFKGTPDERAIVAKYCVKDCRLVNLLINKLETVTKNIEMANVCYVPLPYLFIRGQGIKLFSLCLREFRKHKYVFPVLKLSKLYRCKCGFEYLDKWECPVCKSKKRDEVESESSSYEGAIVFDPVPKVDYEALATKDYASLYPSSIIHKNMSHETIVEDPEYDNIQGITYYNAQFKDSDGSIQYRRYAKIENKLGVIPTILDNLLKERKLIKKQMGKETDPFKYKILDAKQLAVKVTANSLYGQLGAATSPVCKRDIAACTTSTGREMLILAKKYDEEYLSWIFNGLKYFYKTGQEDKVEHMLDLELKARNDQELISDIKKYLTEDIANLTFQPVIRYGDTDSIFSCYRFRENTVSVNKDTALKIWKKVVAFGKKLIEPYFGPKERILFNQIFDEYYSNDKITDLRLPEPPVTLAEPQHHAIILPLEERIKQFVKEYMQESYIPWLWTLAELVEKNYTYMFDIKLTQWAEHQLAKIRLIAEDLTENRKNYLMKPLLEHISTLFSDKYIMPSDSQIEALSNRFISGKTNSFVFSNEIKLSYDQILKVVKFLVEKTIKEKWVYSGERKELQKIINKFVADTSDNTNKDSNKISHYLTEFIGVNKNLDLNTLSDLLTKNLLSDTDMGLQFNESKLNEHTIPFIELYNKNNGKKTMDEIIEEFLEKDLELKFDHDKLSHYNKVIDFVNNHMRYLDMSQMDEERYFYYWIQPRWDFDMTTDIKKKIYMIDIYEGGQAVTDKRTLEYGMKMGKLSGETIKSRLPFPHDCEYEKTFWPFAILTKKKYVGNKFEFDPKKFKQDFMGIVLKRRDNAPIVKEICGGIIDQLINHRSPQGAKDFVRKCIQDLFDGKYHIKYFLTSKTLKLKESYKDWKKIAHVYLAEKIAKRDPGNVPQSGDRIEFAVIKVPQPTDGTKLLQGDIIETPKFIKEKNLELDYLFYLTNQIMNPALQFLELVDKDAIKIFNEFIEKYSAPKIKKEPKPKVEKPKKEPKPKVEKVKVEKSKKESKVDKVKKENHELSALDILIKIKSNKKPKQRNYILEIQKFIDEINEYMANNTKEKEYEEIFLDLESFEKIQKQKNKHFDL
jgi:DNA polymerase elongation subunit (family B)